MARGRGTAPLPHPTASSLTLTDAHEEPGERHVHRALHLDIPTTVCIQMSTPDSNEVGTGQHHDRDPCRLPGQHAHRLEWPLPIGRNDAPRTRDEHAVSSWPRRWQDTSDLTHTSCRGSALPGNLDSPGSTSAA